jgi:thiamine pyrophosphate-dependent acetolactate synthase large subunit-like protein
MRLALLALLLPMAAAAQPPKPFTNLQEAVAAAFADAQARTTLPVVLIGSEDVTWRDGSLGCPQRGMAYTQALVPGYRVRLQAGDRAFDYHASARGALVLCPEGRARSPAPADPTR